MFKISKTNSDVLTCIDRDLLISDSLGNLQPLETGSGQATIPSYQYSVLATTINHTYSGPLIVVVFHSVDGVFWHINGWTTFYQESLFTYSNVTMSGNAISIYLGRQTNFATPQLVYYKYKIIGVNNLG